MVIHTIRIQVWTQLVSSECDYGMLSSFTRTIFFYKANNTLYMSETFSNKTNVLFATYCWVQVALGRIRVKDLYLPEVKTDWWQRLRPFNSEQVGIVDT